LLGLSISISLPNKRQTKATGVKSIKKIMPKISGLIILPRNFPRTNHALLNGERILALKNEMKNKINAAVKNNAQEVEGQFL
jgi:hypothetical protein